MSKEVKKGEATKPPAIGMWHMLRDVFIASMNKGQFPLALFAFILISLIVKMPADDVSRLVFSIIDKLEKGTLISQALLLTTWGGWFFHARYQRRIIDGEIERLSEARTTLQRSQLGHKIKSSEDL